MATGLAAAAGMKPPVPAAPAQPTAGSPTEKSKVPIGIFAETVGTDWLEMLIRTDEISLCSNIGAAVSSWLILVAYMLMPVTFTLDPTKESTVSRARQVERMAAPPQMTVTGMNYYPVSLFCLVIALIGLLGSIVMWLAHRSNYMWTCDKIFQPIAMFSFGGFISTLVTVLTIKQRYWSFTASVTAIVSSVFVCVAGFAYWHYFRKLRKYRKHHLKTYHDPFQSYKPGKRLRRDGGG